MEVVAPMSYAGGTPMSSSNAIVKEITRERERSNNRLSIPEHVTAICRSLYFPLEHIVFQTLWRYGSSLPGWEERRGFKFWGREEDENASGLLHGRGINIYNCP